MCWAYTHNRSSKLRSAALAQTWFMTAPVVAEDQNSPRESPRLQRSSNFERFSAISDVIMCVSRFRALISSWLASKSQAHSLLGKIALKMSALSGKTPEGVGGGNTAHLCLQITLFVAPPPHVEKESGSLSMTYLPRPTESIGTPGIFLTLRFKSRSLVATMYIRFFIHLSTMPICIVSVISSSTRCGEGRPSTYSHLRRYRCGRSHRAGASTSRPLLS